MYCDISHVNLHFRMEYSFISTALIFNYEGPNGPRVLKPNTMQYMYIYFHSIDVFFYYCPLKIKPQGNEAQRTWRWRVEGSFQPRHIHPPNGYWHGILPADIFMNGANAPPTSNNTITFVLLSKERLSAAKEGRVFLTPTVERQGNF